MGDDEKENRQTSLGTGRDLLPLWGSTQLYPVTKFTVHCTVYSVQCALYNLPIRWCIYPHVLPIQLANSRHISLSRDTWAFPGRAEDTEDTVSLTLLRNMRTSRCVIITRMRLHCKSLELTITNVRGTLYDHVKCTLYFVYVHRVVYGTTGNVYVLRV